ncbi:peptidylprolyl isomerase domain and WD repeat-containing protein 1-like isoform X2 [Amphibalanus amphitrite]|nr:peptidylprolyl isomerase domain and WD repeat-containing protein 1-like isoform X2 [Amphibalanus amphitrite]XP_043225176.1 peptidylprolyl isomerase domain and WD repeat-containing protein 1-like isoform X2 [Amphibalanus amphitrite]XP_043225177.1 peptidylprolyl isomerase domain and WD repeat-containing protein 1-like isoform X2 [Amphibalanus amphitrite]XP_043225178.1 peptidylprolyl isomerase domain and WD repeat-containing protein 1-like isoform X2 [Amphibalanus amphitrite]
MSDSDSKSNSSGGESDEEKQKRRPQQHGDGDSSALTPKESGSEEKGQTEDSRKSEAPKRSHDEAEADAGEDDDGWIGPMPSEAAPVKKQKVLEFEEVYLENLPSTDCYEKSFMHRDVVTHLVCTKTDFIVTASSDGHVKFWRKEEVGIEFVKHFRAHLGAVQDMAASGTGALLCTISADKSVKIFDVINFDMINMMKLPYVPRCCQWVHAAGDALAALAISEADSPQIHVYDGRAGSEPLHTFAKLHTKPVVLIQYNVPFHAAVSADEAGMIEYWTGPKHDYQYPRNVRFESKLDTDLFEFARRKTVPRALSFSPDGRLFATIAADRKIRVFRFLTGKLTRVLDESIAHYTELQQAKQQVPSMEFGKRMAVERELEKSSALNLSTVLFDESGHFLMYATMLGVKLINLHTNRLVKLIGKPENVRFLQLALFQGKPKKLVQSSVTMEMEASDNPTLEATAPDPTLFCTGFKKNRFYLFSRREPAETRGVDVDRDVLNEKPTKEDMIAATESSASSKLYENAVIHTSLGDIHLKLFPNECPKTVENFCVHARNGYYNGHIFHRVIKAFMIQTGDPLGTGTGGESIWGGEFQDEFHPSLRHDRPYTLSMANAGPNTNGSQFFITLIPTPWLDNKHTVFGRCTRGMEVCQNIGLVKTNPKTDKPYDDVTIINISVK